MRELILFCNLLIILIIVKGFKTEISSKDTVNSIHRPANYNDQGFWKKHTEWRVRWVKEWHEKKILIPFWRKVWGPIEIHEWVPLPKLPPWNPDEQKSVDGA